MEQFLPEWGVGKDYTMKDVVHKEWCHTAKETIKLPAGPIVRDQSDDKSAMGMAGSDDRFIDGDAYVPPPKRAKSVSATVLFPATGKAREHPPAVTHVDGNHNDHTPVKSNVDPEKASQNSPLHTTCDTNNGPKSFKVKLVQAGAKFLPPPNLLIPSSNASKLPPALPSSQTPAKKAPLLPEMVHDDGTWVCCSITYTELQHCCTKCHRWKSRRSKLSTKAKGQGRKNVSRKLCD